MLMLKAKGAMHAGASKVSPLEHAALVPLKFQAASWKPGTGWFHQVL